MDTNAVSNTGKNIEKEIVYLQSKAIHSNWLVILLAALLLIGVTGGLVYEYGQYKQDLAVAKVKEEVSTQAKQISDQAQADRTKFITETQQAIKSSLAKQQADSKAIDDRNAKTLQSVNTVTEANRDIKNVVQDVRDNLQLEPEIIGNKIAFTVPQVQAIVALKINHDALEANILKYQDIIKESQNQLKISNDQLAKTNDTLDKMNATIKALQDTSEAYKKAAVKSKWAKVKDVGIQVGAAAITGLIIAAATK